MPMMPAGEAIVQIMKAEGVRYVFGLPGGHILPVYDGIYKTPGIDHILVRHEQAAANMAAAYAQLTGEPGVCTVTAGPGATNLVTGIAEASVGSLPIVVFAARGATNTSQKGASQEVPTEKIFAPITKWSIRVDRADMIPEITRRAFTIARSGKPGPVYIDLPRDLLPQEVELGNYVPVPKRSAVAGDPDMVADATRALIKARRPILIAGGGAIMSGAFEEVRTLSEQLAVPVLTSLAGRGIIPDDHPMSVGGLGSHRNPLSKELFQTADVLIGIGTKFEEMETSWRPDFLPRADAKYGQIDIDASEHGRSLIPRWPITGDAKTVLKQMIAIVDESGKALDEKAFKAHARVKRCTKRMKEVEADAAKITAKKSVPMHPLAVIEAARKAFPRETTIGIDVGCLAQHIAGATPYCRVYEPRSLVVPSSFYGMGFVASGFPAAKLVYPDRPALCFVGDGSFQMVMANLACAVEHNLPVTWCILNDEAYGSIRDIQTYVYDQRYLGTDLHVQPNFAMIAEANGCYGERIEASQEIAGAFARALEANQSGKPAVLDFAVSNARMAQSTEFFVYFRGEMPGMKKKSPATNRKKA
jgi:acetolactate synthase-1/2/3 large subunit